MMHSQLNLKMYILWKKKKKMHRQMATHTEVVGKKNPYLFAYRPAVSTSIKNLPIPIMGIQKVKIKKFVLIDKS